MINIVTLRKIPNHGGLTLKNGRPVSYKTGYQVATEGVEITDITKVRAAIKSYNGSCGLWLENGIWYVDKSFRVSTKIEALKIGKENNQISILKWSDMSLIYC